MSNRLKEFLLHPSIGNWKAIILIGQQCAGQPNWRYFQDAVLAALPGWPKEMKRTWPEGIGPPEFKKQVEWLIKETDVYGHFIQRICGDSRLQLNGKQRVWLERRFTGGVVPASTAKQAISTLLEAAQSKSWGPVREAVSVLAGSIRNTGKTGTADLTGGLTIRHTRKGISLALEDTLNVDPLYQSRVSTQNATESQENVIEIRLEIEIKAGDGRQRPEQLARQRSVTSRGGLYILCRSVEEAVQSILKFIAENE